MITPEQLEGVQEITWCTGCGNFGIHAALKKALVELDVPHHELFMVSGIGCSGANRARVAPAETPLDRGPLQEARPAMHQTHAVIVPPVFREWNYYTGHI